MGCLYDFDPDSLDPQQLQDLKEGRFRYTVKHAYETSPFYRNLLDGKGIRPEDIDGIESVTRLPRVTPRDLRQNQPPSAPAHLLKNPRANIRRRFHTSGTTGDAKVVYKSYDEVRRIHDDVRRGYRHLGVTPDDTVVDYFPMVGLNASGFGTEGGLEKLGTETIPIHDTPYPPEKEAQILAEEEPDVLTGLASHIDSKGMAFLDAGYDPATWDLHTIIVAGEPVSESRKEHIRRIYDAEVYEYLGSTEGGAFAYDCRTGEGLHVLGDSVHVEVVDPDTGEPLSIGEEGRLFITNLLHPGEESAMPLLRYQIGDVATMLQDGGGCDCAIGGSVRISSPERADGGFVFGAVNLDPLFFEQTIYEHERLEPLIRNYQLQLRYEEEMGKEVLDVVIESNETVEDTVSDMDVEATAAELENMLLSRNQHLNNTVRIADAAEINVVITDHVDVGTGKPERVIDLR